MVTFYFTEIEGEVVSRSWTLTVPPRVLGTGHRPGGQDLGLFSRIFRMTVTHQDQKNFLSIKIRIVVTFDVFNCIRVGVYDESHKKTNIFVRSTSFRYGSNTDLDQRYLSHSISQWRRMIFTCRTKLDSVGRCLEWDGELEGTPCFRKTFSRKIRTFDYDHRSVHDRPVRLQRGYDPSTVVYRGPSVGGRKIEEGGALQSEGWR